MQYAVYSFGRYMVEGIGFRQGERAVLSCSYIELSTKSTLLSRLWLLPNCHILDSDS